VNEFLEFALLGLGLGAAYSLAAIGLVVVFRASGVVNFAGGAMGTVAAYVFNDLRQGGMDVVLALVICLLLGAALGVATQYLVMSRLTRASAVTKLIATLALFVGLQGAVSLIWGHNASFVASIFPIGVVNLGGGIGIGEDRLCILGLSLALAAVLWVVYTRTLFGLATSAVAENRRAAASLAWSSDRIEAGNWGIGGALYALTAILLAPIVGLDASTLSLLVIPALAAALVGGFASFPLTVAGGLLLGVIESVLTNYVTVQGVAGSVPFLVIVAVIVAGGRTRPTRGDLPSRLPLPGRGTINVPLVVTCVVSAELFIWLATPDWVDAMIVTLVTSLLVLSVVVVTGLGGQLSLCQWALSGVSALIAGRLVAGAGLPFWAAAILGVLAAVPAGIVVALPAFRARGVNLGVATLGLALAIQAVILNNVTLTGGFNGTNVGSPTLFGLSIDPVAHPARYATLALAVFVVMALAVANVRRGATGRRMLAVRSNERVAASLGISVYGLKVYAFALGALAAGAAGVITAFQTRNIIFLQFDPISSINAVLYSVIGGVGWVSGVIPGAQMAPDGLAGNLVSGIGNISDWLPVISAVLLILTVMQAPDGVAKLTAERVQKIRKRLPATRRTRAKAQLAGVGSAFLRDADRRPTPRARRDPVALSIKGLTVSYGGVVAVKEVDFIARPGEVTGLIGPNGAGKTSLLDAISGFARPSSGTMSFGEDVINKWSVERRARRGLARAFQAVELFPEMTVGENLLVAAEHSRSRKYVTDLVRPGRVRVSELMRDVIAEFELEAYLDERPQGLPHGTARLVGIARSLVADARILLLDEPAAGLDLHERRELGRLIRRIATERNVALVLVEHDVELVMRTCDRIAVLDFGRRIAEGTPAEIEHNPAVMRAYLGTAIAEEAIA
jgi:ABC-type branched-subunit amino acid transport system ATPase component/branched-subunit amino acid ABC-type transport system permease component